MQLAPSSYDEAGECPVTRRSDRGDQTPSERRHVAVSMGVGVRDRLKEAAGAHDWSMGDLALAFTAEHRTTIATARAGREPVRRMTRGEPTVVVGLYMTPQETAELDDVAQGCGLTRSALVETAVRLGVGDDPEVALRPVLRQ